MKKLLLAAVGLLSLSTISAQTKTDDSGVRFGLKGGVNFSNGKYTSPVGYKYDSKYETGYYGGGLAELSFPKGSKFKLQGEVLYNKFKLDKSFESPIIRIDQKTDINQLQVPIFAKYFVTPGFSINAGLLGNFNLKATNDITNNNKTTNTTITTTSEWPEKNLNTFQGGALVGVELYIHEGFFIDARYNHLFSSPYKGQPASEYKDLNTIQVGLGFKF